MKKLILLPFLVFGQFLAHAQKPAKKTQQVITLNLLPAGSVHLPKIKKDKNKDTMEQLKEELNLAPNRNLAITEQVTETVIDEKDTPAKGHSVIYTITSL